MSDGKLGLAILGAGIFALEAHVPAILACPDISFKAVYSRSSRTATSFSLAKPVVDLNLDVYHGDDGLHELLKREDIGAVIIALPIAKQPEIVEMALKAGKHVLSEKPIGPDVASAKKLIEVYESQYKSKNLQWRVAENFAHEPAVLRTAELISSGTSPLGPVLYYDVKVVGSVASGSKYHATEWRTVPQYQGGFLLDGGVHSTAALRVVLGDLAPTHLIGQASLHRTHLGPHDTISALTSIPSRTASPHGEDFPQPENLEMGKSTPSGTFIMSFASPRTPAPMPQTYTITCLNAVVRLSMAGKWKVEVLTENQAAIDFAGQAAKEGGETFESVGVKEEVRQFAQTILGKSKESNKGEPQSALWDVEFIQAALTSNGKNVELASL